MGRSDELSLLAELRSLYDVAQTEIETLELEFQLQYVNEVDYQRRIIQFRTTREQLSSRLQLLELEVILYIIQLTLARIVLFLMLHPQARLLIL